MSIAPQSHALWHRLADPLDPTPRMRDVVGLSGGAALAMSPGPDPAPTGGPQEPAPDVQDLHGQETASLATRPWARDPAVRQLEATGYHLVEVVLDDRGAVNRALGVGRPGWGDKEDLSGATLPPCYYLEGRHAEGGMGVIYRARHLYLDRSCAVKVPRLPTSPEERRRLRREARLGARVDHPNVVRVFDCGQLRDLRPFLVMELLRGPSLRHLLQGEPLSPARACRLAAQVAEGLAALHALGVVHRDIKPSNLLVLPDGPDGESERVKIVDLGLSKRPGEPEDAEISIPGVVLGTPGYLAPEQRRGEDADPRTDQYALGCVLFEMLTGARVGQAVEPPLHLLDELPAGLAAIVRRALAEDPGERYPEIAALAQALLGACSGLGTSARAEELTIAA